MARSKRSEELRELLSLPPPWLLRWGALTAFVAFILLAYLAFFLEYPEKVTAPILVSYSEEPRRLVSPESNYIEELRVQNDQMVEEGELLLVFRNKARYEHVLQLQDQLFGLSDSVSTSDLLQFNPPRTLILGDLQADLFNFFDQQDALRQLQAGSQDGSRSRSSLSRQIRNFRNSRQYDEQQLLRVSEGIDQQYQEIARIEKRAYNGQATYESLREAQQELVNLKAQRDQINADIRFKRARVGELEDQLDNLEKGNDLIEEKAVNRLKDSFFRLKLRTRDWLDDNILIAPVSGMVQIVGNAVGEQQFVRQGKELLVVIPSKKSELIGRMQLPFERSGKVQEGQKAVVRLKSYPWLQYGAVHGVVYFKSRVTDQSGNLVPVEIHFPRGLLSTSNHRLPVEEVLLGEADIIIDQRNLISWVFQKNRITG